MSWIEQRRERQAKRAKNRDYALRTLTKLGFAYTEVGTSWHVRIEHEGVTINFTPGSGSWLIYDEGSPLRGHYRGVHNLIAFLLTGKIPAPAHEWRARAETSEPG